MPSAVKKTAAKKTAAATKSDKPTNGAKKKKTPVADYSMYIHKMLKAASKEGGGNRNLSISKDAMPILNKLLEVCFEKIATKAGKVTIEQKKKTLSAKEMKLACELVLPRQLAGHACNQGHRALTRFNN